MAIVANTFTKYSAVGIRENLSDLIAQISPESTPFQSSIRRDPITQTFTEWMTDSLAAADVTNAVIDGDDISSYQATPATLRLGNYTQISRKTAVLADNLQVIDSAGGANRMSYVVAQRGAELKRDIESIILNNQAAVAGNNTTARKTAGLPAFIRTNSSRGTGGADPTVSGGVVNAAATDASTANRRAFTESMLKTVAQEIYTAGGKPKVLMMGPHNTSVAAGFAGIAAQRYQAPANKPTTIQGAASVYLSQWGEITFVTNLFQRERDAFILDHDYCALAVLRPIKAVTMAKTGDASKKMLLSEYALKVDNDAAIGVVADLTAA